MAAKLQRDKAASPIFPGTFVTHGCLHPSTFPDNSGVRQMSGEGVVRRNGLAKGCFWRVRFFSAPLRANLKGAEKKQTLQNHPFGRPFLRTTSSSLAWHALKFASICLCKTLNRDIFSPLSKGSNQESPRQTKPKKGQNEKFMNFALFCEFWCFSLGKQARFTLNFCSGMPLRKVHELTFLWFGLPGPLLIKDRGCMKCGKELPWQSSGQSLGDRGLPTTHHPHKRSSSSGGILGGGMVCELSEPKKGKNTYHPNFALAMFIIDFVGVVRGSHGLRVRKMILVSVKFSARNSGAGNGCANFTGAWKHAFFLQEKPCP